MEEVVVGIYSAHVPDPATGIAEYIETWPGGTQSLSELLP